MDVSKVIIIINCMSNQNDNQTTSISYQKANLYTKEVNARRTSIYQD